MVTLKETRLKYKEIHDELAAVYYPLKRAGLVDTELEAIFITSHAENEANREAELKTASDYIEPVPPRDLEAEIDELKARLDKMR